MKHWPRRKFNAHCKLQSMKLLTRHMFLHLLNQTLLLQPIAKQTILHQVLLPETSFLVSMKMMIRIS